MKHWTVVALAGALLWAGCKKEQPAAPAPAPKPVAAAEPEPAEEAAPAEEAEPESEAPAEEATAEPEAPRKPRVDDGVRPEFKVGQSREEVMQLFDGCAERRVFIPPGPGGTPYVEVYQAINDEACIKRLGDRHFLIKGGALYSIDPGRMAEPQYIPPPEGV